MNLATEIKDFVILFKPEARGDAPRVPMRITRAKAEKLDALLGRSTVKFITIRDDDGNYQETIEASSIKRVAKVGTEESSAGYMKMVCDYGTRHPHKGKDGFEDCKCVEKFKVSGFEFWERMKGLYKEIEYSSDITKTMIQVYLRNY